MLFAVGCKRVYRQVNDPKYIRAHWVALEDTTRALRISTATLSLWVRDRAACTLHSGFPLDWEVQFVWSMIDRELEGEFSLTLHQLRLVQIFSLQLVLSSSGRRILRSDAFLRSLESRRGFVEPLEPISRPIFGDRACRPIDRIGSMLLFLGMSDSLRPMESPTHSFSTWLRSATP